MQKNKRNITGEIPNQCLLDDGRIVDFNYAISVDFFNKHEMSLEQEGFVYLGEGVHYSLHGVISKDKPESKSKVHFWHSV